MSVRLWRGLDEIPADGERSVVAVGTFDGVHRGHQKFLSHAREHANRLDLPFVVVTFDLPPGLVAGTLDPPVVLTTAERKAELLAEHGADAVCLLAATPELAALPARDLARRILVEGVPTAVALLPDRDDDGVVYDIDAVHALGKEYEFTVEELAVDSTESVTSAQVRSLVLAGDVAGARSALGPPGHRVDGVVVHGAARGRELLGFPTANLDCPPHIALPADGVYAGWLLRRDIPSPGTEARWPAAISVGTNPTFDGHVRTVEAYALDRDDLELYGLPMAVEFTHHIRPMLRFDSIDELIDAMRRDVDRCRELLVGR